MQPQAVLPFENIHARLPRQFYTSHQFSGRNPQLRTRSSREILNAAERWQNMNAINPVYIPRNHLVDEAIVAANMLRHLKEQV